ncbi:SMP-30/gluconolactonase/LRE family protein [Aureimonas pseudogalii]|uniref:Lactonase n=1 Tax=Aureimonas pseudogalii TaxID=1744844 RepID=A0A7W6EDH7_9HYPH|nr:SMP-30/gluconolactonase/LRE family protein [Aureimonas pseudogalii]MBB3996675.1 lactonase [Aureimonas pseudogalii]
MRCLLMTPENSDTPPKTASRQTKADRYARKRRAFVLATGMAVSIMPNGASMAAAPDLLPGLVADERLRGEVPIPVAERDIPTVVAKPWVRILEGPTPLEGVAFSTSGEILLCDVGGGRVLRLTSEGVVSPLLERGSLGPGGLAIDTEGRVFVAAAGDLTAGTVGSLPEGGDDWQEILPTSAGYVPNDLVLDGRGGFYFTDFKGSAFEATGGVHHRAADGTITSIVTGLALPNGIALSPDRRTLWIAEHGRNRLVRVRLDGATQIARLGIDVVYHFIGPKPDTVRTDAEGNVYVALNGQGRVLVLSPGGIPIGQILLPGREDGRNLRSTSFAIRPGGDEIVIVASDGERGGGGWTFRARTFGHGHR